MKKCRKIKRGSTIGVLCCSSSCTGLEDRLERFIEICSRFDLKVKIGKTIYLKDGYLSGSNKDRADELMSMFSDEEIDAILCFKGGFGAAKILDLLNFDSFRDNPKLLVGFSDVTCLLNAIVQNSGCFTLHGEMPLVLGKTTIDEFTLNHFFDSLFNSPKLLKNPKGDAKTISGGICEGRIAGGNLSLIINSIGTPFEVDFKGKIVLLEDVSEKPYRLDGMFNQLRLAGKLNECVGVVLGYFTDCDAPDPTTQNVDWLINEYFSGLGIPVVADFATGHATPFLNVPIGANARLDADLGTLEILEDIYDKD